MTKKTNPVFKLGDIVSWISQAQGCTRKKVGEIVEVVPPGEYPDRDRFLPLYKGSGVGLCRDHESYVVEARQVSGRKTKKIYWPRVNQLQTERIVTGPVTMCDSCDIPVAGRPYPQWQVQVVDPAGTIVGAVKFAPDIGKELARIHGVDAKAEIVGITLTEVERILTEVLKEN